MGFFFWVFQFFVPYLSTHRTRLGLGVPVQGQELDPWGSLPAQDIPGFGVLGIFHPMILKPWNSPWPFSMGQPGIIIIIFFILIWIQPGKFQCHSQRAPSLPGSSRYPNPAIPWIQLSLHTEFELRFYFFFFFSDCNSNKKREK